MHIQGTNNVTFCTWFTFVGLVYAHVQYGSVWQRCGDRALKAINAARASLSCVCAVTSPFFLSIIVLLRALQT
ncbi:hypothetical protein BJV78DRAFT_1237434 [Lactifluus subvellereus]|nr:hypothetical protein BJV78DRAFT_1237434 [Lactifluus subvellereus]